MSKHSENTRLEAAKSTKEPWKKWGPYLSERQWGTVREDYSENGNAWDYFSHDQARSRTYRWGEDGLAGISDDEQRLCFSLVLWNGQDPILKERLFGVASRAGGPCSVERMSSRLTRTGAIISCSISTSTATTVQASVPATRPGGRGSSPVPCTRLQPQRPNRHSVSAKKLLTRK